MMRRNSSGRRRRPNNRLKRGRDSIGGSRSHFDANSPGLRNAIPIPPLFSPEGEDRVQKGDTQEDLFDAPKPASTKTSPLEKPEKPLVSKLTANASAFVPIEKAPLSKTTGKVVVSTPPASPYYCVEIMPSPPPSGYSTAPTEDSTERPFTPCNEGFYPISPGLVDTPGGHNRNESPVLSLRNNYPSTPSAQTVVVSPLSSPRKSPTKSNRRGGALSPFSPYSPGGGSVSSYSTTAEAVVRKQRAKTELCNNFRNGKQCPFGVNCTYAHGEEELQKRKLVDLQRAGLIEDIETYRTKPCWTWVATGSCPFGSRCVCIHDPRVAGSNSSWLTHTETQGNSISTDINVDALHQKRLASTLYSTPFGEAMSLELDQFADLYKTICNTTSNNKRRRNQLTETHKLSIALQMRGSSNWMYKFRPAHFIYGELCMVLQKRAFVLAQSGHAEPIPLSAYRSRISQHVLVREIAFGPDSDPAVRGVALWFNIPDAEVAECTQQQAKRFRWKKPAKLDDARFMETRSVFESRECFIMVRPSERDAYDFATDVLYHRFKMVQAESIPQMKHRFAALKVLKEEKEVLQDRFNRLKNFWISWSYPMNRGRQTVDDSTPVPAIDGNYEPLIDYDAIQLNIAIDDDGEDESSPVEGGAVNPIWESFVQHCPLDFLSAKKRDMNKKHVPPVDENSKPRSRLGIFKGLANGEEISSDRSLPHILYSRPVIMDPPSNGVPRQKAIQAIERQSTCCWKALLLKDKDNNTKNDWAIVQEHFQKARCKKVLNILQQPSSARN